MTIATEIIRGAEAIEKAIELASPKGFPGSDDDRVLRIAATTADQAMWASVAYQLAVLLAATANDSGDMRFMEVLFRVAERVSDYRIGKPLSADNRNAIGVIASAVEEMPSVAKRIALDIEKELGE